MILGLSSHNYHLLNALGLASALSSDLLTLSTIPANSSAGASSFTLNNVDFAFKTQSYLFDKAHKESSLNRNASRNKRLARLR